MDAADGLLRHPPAGLDEVLPHPRGTDCVAGRWVLFLTVVITTVLERDRGIAAVDEALQSWSAADGRTPHRGSHGHRRVHRVTHLHRPVARVAHHLV